jgi:hypothetical protein
VLFGKYLRINLYKNQERRICTIETLMEAIVFMGKKATFLVAFLPEAKKAFLSLRERKRKEYSEPQQSK